MSQRYSWQELKSQPAYRASGQDHLAWWAAAAMLVSILLHVLVFFALDRVKFVLGIDSPGEIVTERVVITRPVDEVPQEFLATPPPEEMVIPPPDTKSLVEEIDLLADLEEQEIDMSPQVVDTTIALQVANPAASGSLEGAAPDVSAGLDLAADLPEFGREVTELRPVAVGQMTIDPGAVSADDTELTKFTEDLRKRGANGTAEKGSLDGLTSIDDLIGLKENDLIGKTTMLPSDLLFPFNKYELRESAKVGLLKLGLLIDSNPTMYCWIEGHTDLIGGDEANLELSRKRAEAVKDYLVNSMKMPGDRIITRGFGRFQPIITSGDQDQQAPNRRVEIKMRKTPPTADQIKISPPKAPAVAEETPPAPRPAPVPVREMPAPAPRAVLVKPDPQRAIPVEVVPTPPAPVEPIAPKATPVVEPPPVARPVEPEPARALPVEEEPAVPRAQPVEE